MDDLDELFEDTAGDDARASANRAGTKRRAFHAAGDTNLAGGAFTPFKDIWNSVASDLGITTKRMRNDAMADAAHEEAVFRDTQTGILSELDKQEELVRSPEDAAKLRNLRSQMDVAERLRSSNNPKFQELGANLIGKILDDQRAFADTQEVQRITKETNDATMARELGNETWNRYGELRDDYGTETKPYATRKNAWTVMQTAAFHPDHGGDVARTNAFMHMIEPNSMVMPGEAANVAGLGGVPDLLVTAISKVMNEGGTYTADQRKELDQFARDLMTNANKEHTEISNRYAAQARHAGIPEAMISDLMIPVADTAAPPEADFGARAPSLNTTRTTGPGPGPDQTDSKPRMAGESVRDSVGSLFTGALEFLNGAVPWPKGEKHFFDGGTPPPPEDATTFGNAEVNEQGMSRGVYVPPFLRRRPGVNR